MSEIPQNRAAILEIFERNISGIKKLLDEGVTGQDSSPLYFPTLKPEFISRAQRAKELFYMRGKVHGFFDVFQTCSDIPDTDILVDFSRKIYETLDNTEIDREVLLNVLGEATNKQNDVIPPLVREVIFSIAALKITGVDTWSAEANTKRFKKQEKKVKLINNWKKKKPKIIISEEEKILREEFNKRLQGMTMMAFKSGYYYGGLEAVNYLGMIGIDVSEFMKEINDKFLAAQTSRQSLDTYNSRPQDYPLSGN